MLMVTNNSKNKGKTTDRGFPYLHHKFPDLDLSRDVGDRGTTGESNDNNYENKIKNTQLNSDVNV